MGADYTGKFRLYKKSDWTKLPGMRWLIKDLIPQHGTTLLYGQPKIGKKSFIGISMACAVASGKLWCGFATRHAKVLYVVGEGFYGILRRQAAWEKLHGQVGDGLRYLRSPINFFDKSEVGTALEALKDQGFEPDFIIIDTLARSMSGGKENDTGDMSRVFELIELFRTALNDAGILLIHHTTKDGLSYRGSSVTPAAVDGLIESKSNGLVITLISAGFKDAAEFATFSVRCENVLVETEDGWEDVLAVKDRITVTDILNQPADDKERHGRALVRLMVEHFSKEGATNAQLLKRSGMSPSTFDRGRKWATEKGWIIGGGRKGVPYQLNPDESWKGALGIAITSTTPTPSGVGSDGSNNDDFHGSDLEVIGSESNSRSPKGEKSAEVGIDPLGQAAELLKKAEV